MRNSVFVQRRFKFGKLVLAILMVYMCTIVVPGANDASADAPEHTLYASPEGSGTDCTLLAPCSLTGARDKVRTLNESMTGDILVYLRGGEYELVSTFVLEAEDSGMNGYTVSYEAYPAETPVLSGGQRVTGWVQEGQLWKADVGTGNEARQLYVNDRRAVRAKGELAGAKNVTAGHTTTNLDMQNWDEIQDMEFVYDRNWTQSRCGVQSIAGNLITMDQPCLTMGKAKRGLPIDNVTWIENAFELLDEPGEWYMNRSTGYLYYMPLPGESIGTVDAVLPELEKLVEGDGTVDAPVENIRFAGITFAYAGWTDPNGSAGFVEVQAGFTVPPSDPVASNPDLDVRTLANLTFTAAKGIRIEDNVFKHLGAAGLEFMLGSQNNVISGNEFHDISASAVQIGGITADDHHPSDSRLIVLDNEVTNNYIHDIGAEYAGGVGIFAGYTEGTLISHNELVDLPYSGISVGWGWGVRDFPGNPSTSKDNLITHNRIHDHMKELFDGGGIYTLGSLPGTVISGNLIYDQRNDFGAVYLDLGSKFITMEHNVIYDNTRNFIGTGSGHTIENNYWDDDSRNMYQFTDSTDTENNVIVASGHYPLWIVNNAGLEQAYDHLLPEDGVLNAAAGAYAASILPGEAAAPMELGHEGSKAFDQDLSTSADAVASLWVLQAGLDKTETVSAIAVHFADGGAPSYYELASTVNGTDWVLIGGYSGAQEGGNIVYVPDQEIRTLRIGNVTGAMAIAELEVYTDGEPVPLVWGYSSKVNVAAAFGSTVLSSSAPLVADISGTSLLETYDEGAADIEVRNASTNALLYTLPVAVADFAQVDLDIEPTLIAVGRSAAVSMAGTTGDGVVIPLQPTLASSDDGVVEAVTSSALSGEGVGEAVITATVALEGRSIVRTADVEGYEEQLAEVTLLTDQADYVEADIPLLSWSAKYDSGYPVEPIDASVSYSSDNTAVAQVNAVTGEVTLTGAGKAVITAAVTVDSVTKNGLATITVFPDGWELAAVNGAETAALYDNDESWTLESKGGNIWGTEDSFAYLYRNIDMGDYPDGVSIIAKVSALSEDVHPDSMLGVMMRGSPDEGAAHVNYRLHGTSADAEKRVPFVYRTADDGATSYAETPKLTLPATIRLSRYEDSFYAHYLNGSNQWILVAQRHDVVMDEEFTVGIAHTSNTAEQASTTVIDSLEVVAADDLYFDAMNPIDLATTASILEVGDTLELTATGAGSGETIIYSSSNDLIATVDANGEVTALDAGEVTITATALRGLEERPVGGSDQVTLILYDDLGDLTTENAALGKAASAWDPAGTTALTPNQPIGNGVDGNLGTVISAAGSYAWQYRVDLGQLYTTKSIGVQFFTYAYATEYEILGSVDGVTWNQLEHSTSGGPDEMFVLMLPEPTGLRYVAVKAIKPDAVGQTGAQMAIAELEVNAYALP